MAAKFLCYKYLWTIWIQLLNEFQTVGTFIKVLNTIEHRY